MNADCQFCRKANKSCLIWPRTNPSKPCVEFIDKRLQADNVIELGGNQESHDIEFVPVDELFADVINQVFPLKNCNSSEWHHMQCGVCSKWWAIEGVLVQSKFNCPHCGAVNEKKDEQ